MLIRSAEPKDVPAIVRIEAEAYHPEIATSERGFRGIFDAGTPSEFLEICEREGEVVGFAHFSMNNPEPGVCGLWDIAVESQFRGQRLGFALLQHVLDQARAVGAKWVTLNVPEDNPAARKLYERCGFSVSGRVPKYYPPQGVRTPIEFSIDALVMSCELKHL